MFRNDDISQTLLYERIAKLPPSLFYQPFQEFIPVVTDEALDTGILFRYFIRQTNQPNGYIAEVDEQTYQRMTANAIYQTIQLPWRISGKLDDEFGPRQFNTAIRTYTGVKTANELMIAEAEKEMPGIKNKLLNPVQLWIGR